MLVQARIDAWSDGATTPAAKALTTSLVAYDAFRTRMANRLRLGVQTSGTAPTHVEVAVDWSDDGFATANRCEVINNVSGGEVDQDDGVWLVPGATANKHTLTVEVPPGCEVKVYAARDGGDATSAALIKGTLTRE